MELDVLVLRKMAITTTLKDQAFRDEVRTALGELDQEVVSDAMIDQQKDRFVIPDLEDHGIDGSNDEIDTALIAMTAEKAFKRWLKKSQITSGQSSVAINTKEHKKDLEQQTAEALSQLGIEKAPGSVGTPFVDSSDGLL